MHAVMPRPAVALVICSFVWRMHICDATSLTVDMLFSLANACLVILLMKAFSLCRTHMDGGGGGCSREYFEDGTTIPEGVTWHVSVR